MNQPQPDDTSKAVDAALQAAEAAVNNQQTAWWQDGTNDNLAMVTAYMAQHHYTAEQVAYCVEKPWKHNDTYREARADCELENVADKFRYDNRQQD